MEEPFEHYFAVCSPGLEPFTARELSALGLLPSGNRSSEAITPGSGGVEFSGRLIDGYRANLHLRTASRVLLRVGEFFTAGFPELRRKAARLPWERFLAPGQPVALRVTCHKSRLYHTGAVAERVLAAIGDRLGTSSPEAKFDENAIDPLPQLLVVRIASDLCTISVDTSGEHLHRRGYRLATAKAPLRETLAAGMLMAAGWERASPLLDPFCGSGTIAIEAAWMATGRPPGLDRRFAFMEWPSFRPKLWEKLVGSKPSSTRIKPVILASDRDAGAIEAANANARRAGVEEMIEFSTRAVSAIEPPEKPGWVVTNPPYGLRVSATRDVRNLYAQLGKVLREKCPGWTAAILCNELALLRQTKLRLDINLWLVNGGIKVVLGRGPVS